MEDAVGRALTRRMMGTAALAAAIGLWASNGLAAAPPLAADVAPPGVWNLVRADDATDPWPRVDVQLGVADDGVTVLVDTGCERFMAVASRDRSGVALDRRSSSSLRCEGDRAAAEATVAPVLADLDTIEVLAGRLHVRGAGRVLVYALDALPAPSGVPGTPPVASSDRLDPSRFAAAVDASAANGAHWVRDPLQVALLFVDDASTARTTIVRDELPGDATTVVRFWFGGLRDDAVRARWFEVRLERGPDDAWRVAAARRAALCARGDAADALVAGRCP